MATNQEKTTRGVIYALTRVILFVIAVLVIALGFFTGMNSMNVNVIIKDAFELRQEFVLQPKGLTSADLAKLFTQDFIKSDTVLNSTKYQEYDITSYYQRSDVGFAIVWPWMDTVTVRATENVLDIQGTRNNSEDAAASSGNASAADAAPPTGESAEYDVTLVKDANTSSWKVREMKKIKEVQPVINQPSQTPSPSESGTKSAKPSATASASVQPTESAE